MKTVFTLSLFFTSILSSLLLWSCSSNTEVKTKEKEIVIKVEDQKPKTENRISETGKTILERFLPPNGFERTEISESSFSAYLRSLPLKPKGSIVKYYDGREKTNGVYIAVVDMDVGKQNLQQCADAIMRLRAEYFYKKKDFDKIHFNFTNGFNAEYSKWRKGQRIKVQGNKCSWTNNGTSSDSYEVFRKYLTQVFMYAGTLSLAKELKKAEWTDMQIGDVLIQGGSPGHAVIVVDMAINKKTGEKLFMLAQSYMPAQETQILHNLNNQQLSPWYSLELNGAIETPEWVFKKGDLRRF